MDYNEYTYCYGGGRGGWYSSLASSSRPPASSFSPGGNQSVRPLERAGFSPAADFFGGLSLEARSARKAGHFYGSA